jgi:hypothetical protein
MTFPGVDANDPKIFFHDFTSAPLKLTEPRGFEIFCVYHVTSIRGEGIKTPAHPIL